VIPAGQAKYNAFRRLEKGPDLTGVFLSLPLPRERKNLLQKIKSVLDTFARQKYQKKLVGIFTL